MFINTNNIHAYIPHTFYMQLQVLQKQYDELQITEDTSAEKQAEAEAMANSMIALLTTIEGDRLKYTEKRDALKRMKLR